MHSVCKATAQYVSNIILQYLIELLTCSIIFRFSLAEYHCIDSQGAAVFQTLALFIDSAGSDTSAREEADHA